MSRECDSECRQRQSTASSLAACIPAARSPSPLPADWRALLQMSLAERDKKRHNLTLRELESLPEGTNTYQGVGKMFLLVLQHARAAHVAASVR